jgi:hypothetical protein
MLSVTASFALGLALCATPARASIVYETNTGVSDQDGLVDARATFAFGTNSLTLTLENLETGYKAAGQAISGIIFTIGGSPTGETFTGGSAVHITLDNNGNITSPASGPTATTKWGLTSTNPTGLTALTGGQPDEMIIGPPDSVTGNYPNFNGQTQFNPYLQQSATFTFTFTGGVTSSTDISNVHFQFGTKPDFTTTTEQSHVVNPLAPSPEPATLGMAVFAVVASAGYAWRRRRRTAA